MLKHIIQKIGYDYDIEIVELEIPVDHIHMVVDRNRKTPRQTSCKNKESIRLRVFQDSPRDQA